MFIMKIVVALVVLLIGFLIIKSGIKFEKNEYSGRNQITSIPVARIAVAILLVLGTLITMTAWGTVPAGHRGVVLRFGATTGRILDPGFYQIVPVAESVALMDVRTQAYTAAAAAASADIQDVATSITLNYSLDPGGVVLIYDELRYDYELRIVKPAIEEAVKASTAQYDATELITRRPEVRDSILNAIIDRLESKYLIVDALQITQFEFSEIFTAAIESKVEAEQQALRAENQLERVKFEAQQQIEQAKAEAESLRLQKENVSEDLIELRRIEAQILAINRWNGTLPQYVTNDSPVPIIDVFRK
jgi:regulator of protease activity HflC (stomatin/prohibitin superfamily)